jgi:hypothetical protein
VVTSVRDKLLLVNCFALLPEQRAEQHCARRYVGNYGDGSGSILVRVQSFGQVVNFRDREDPYKSARDNASQAASHGCKYQREEQTARNDHQDHRPVVGQNPEDPLVRRRRGGHVVPTDGEPSDHAWLQANLINHETETPGCRQRREHDRLEIVSIGVEIRKRDRAHSGPAGKLFISGSAPLLLAQSIT